MMWAVTLRRPELTGFYLPALSCVWTEGSSQPFPGSLTAKPPAPAPRQLHFSRIHHRLPLKTLESIQESCPYLLHAPTESINTSWQSGGGGLTLNRVSRFRQMSAGVLLLNQTEPVTSCWQSCWLSSDSHNPFSNPCS